MRDLNRGVHVVLLACAAVCFAGAAIAATSDVAIDVGHSTKQPGATSASGATEFSLNRLLAQGVDAGLRSRNLRTLVVGAEGDAIRLDSRTNIASGASLFVSLHHDSIKQEWMPRSREFAGYSVFVSRKNVDPQGSLACARTVAAQLQSAGFSPSYYHALEVPGEGRPFADRNLGVHWFDDLVVLKTARQPALLIEAGVIVNPDDELRVTTADGRTKMAAAISSGIAACFKSR